VFAPLFALAAADDVIGISRGIAFQLIESLGVLERQRVADDVKGLDQSARATLRKYGLRFGAYHIYLPALLKPAPRSLAAQLWALKHEHPEVKGLDDIQRLASSGRTSIPVDKETPKSLYRVAGYRICGERAIRVDILERLADLIRPALSWREGGSGPKPPGAFDGNGFTVTGAMTSLTGASGEDFASILRSLGYRMERRPKPPEPEAPAAADTEKVETAAAPDAVAASEEAPALTPEAEPVAETPPGEDAAAAIPDEPQPTASLLPENTFAPPPNEDQAPASEDQVDAPAEDFAAQPAEQTADASISADAASADAPASAEPAQAQAAVDPAEPALIEVWRPGRPSGQRSRRDAGKRRRRPDQPAQQQPQTEGQPVAASAEAPAADTPPPADGERKDGGRPRHRRDRERGEGENRGRPQQRADRPERKDRPDRDARPPRGDRSDRPRRDRDRDDNRPGRTWSSGNERRGKEADPNSPFAKLLALKEQLEANKER
jgi:ATP-dependent RNA helicase SUPV3L1/SUV3